MEKSVRMMFGFPLGPRLIRFRSEISSGSWDDRADKRYSSTANSAQAPAPANVKNIRAYRARIFMLLRRRTSEVANRHRHPMHLRWAAMYLAGILLRSAGKQGRSRLGFLTRATV